MEDKKLVAVCGGDARLLSAAALFSQNGYKCSVWKGAAGDIGGAVRASELRSAAENAAAVILPIPAFSSGGKLVCTGDERSVIDAEYIFSTINSGCTVFAGKVPELVRRLAGEYNITVIDYAQTEEFAIHNAVPTAEAAIFTAMTRLPVTISASRFTVIGYGRIGRALATRLRALDAVVTVAARSKSARALAESDGLLAVSVSDYLRSPPRAAVTFNTVPSPIINDDTVAATDSGLYIDLASAPGGFTDEARTALADRLIIALSLPGKYSPQSAGEIIYKTVSGILEETGVRC